MCRLHKSLSICSVDIIYKKLSGQLILKQINVKKVKKKSKNKFIGKKAKKSKENVHLLEIK